MKSKIALLLATVTLVGFGVSGSALAEDSKKPAAGTEPHDAHHPDEKGKSKSPGPGAGEKDAMMGKMDKNQMMEMMHGCMNMHKSDSAAMKMCDHNMMSKCQESMDKGECQKMMNEAKKVEKNKKK